MIVMQVWHGEDTEEGRDGLGRHRTSGPIYVHSLAAAQYGMVSTREGLKWWHIIAIVQVLARGYTVSTIRKSEVNSAGNARQNQCVSTHSRLQKVT
jgi:hypothetical protein